MEKMKIQKMKFKAEKDLQDAILQEKALGTPDVEIGRKYRVTFRYIERLVTKSKGINISTFRDFKSIKSFSPKDFIEEKTSVWSFKQRGNWATHNGNYRGNWSPYIPRNVILKYSKAGELVLDYFCGAGTTAVECKLLGRECIALDINPQAIELAKRNIDFSLEPQQLTFADDFQAYEPALSVGDARDLSELPDNSIDLICSHPPYANIIHYTDSKQGDLSFLDIEDFLGELSKVAKESFRTLKPGRQCAILIGDTRRSKHVIPLGFKVINVYLRAGFKLKELVIKRQHNCKSTGFWHANSLKYNFLLLAHEYLPIFEKPTLATSVVKERVAQYSMFAPTVLKPSLKRKLDELETTTVWIFPTSDFEKRLNKNVVDRYSAGGGYTVLSFVSHFENEAQAAASTHRNKKLFFIKAPFLANYPTEAEVAMYLQNVKEIVNEHLTELTHGAFIVIQTQDVRLGDYIEPMAKRVVDMLTHDSLWLKEIVVATNEESNSETHNQGKYLNIVHQYLIVYELRDV